MMEIDVTDALVNLRPVIVEAGKRYVEPRYTGGVYEIDFESSPEDPRSYVTAADRHMSDVILPRCREIFPGSYSEEDMKGRGYRGPMFLVDPIDDTLGFVHRLYETSGTLVGLLDRNNRPVGGIAYAPETRTLTLAQGLTSTTEVDGVLQERTGPAGHIVAVQRMDAPNPKLDDFLECLGKELKIEVETIEGGGPGAFAACAGKYDYNFFSGTVAGGNWKEWDAAALEAILTYSGWKVTDLRGNEIAYNNYDPRLYNGLLATRLSHLGLSHCMITDYLARFTEKYGPILVPDSVYKEWAESERAAEWADEIRDVPSAERYKLLRRRKLV